MGNRQITSLITLFISIFFGINTALPAADLTVKNIAFSTITAEGEYSWGNAIVLQADDLRINVESCYFELIGWAIIQADVNHTQSIIINKCEVRNGTAYPDGDEWVPFFIEVNTGSVDTVIMRNNTFFDLQGSVINIETQNLINSFIFDHNTCVNIVKGFTTAINAHVNSVITNNIFYNVGTHGSLIADIQSSQDQLPDAVISADTLVSNLPGSSLPFVMDEKDRIMTVNNNVYFWTQGVKDYWVEFADSLEGNVWMDARTQAMIDDNAAWPHFTAENNVEDDPVFANFGGTSGMVAQMRNHRLNGTFGFWGWDPDSSLYPDVHWAFLQWPLPEDFSYSASFTSTDGYHVGSLQWYPAELAQYEEDITGVEDENGNYAPKEFSLKQNYPNPFNPSTTVSFSLNEAGIVSLSIFNTLGQKVKNIYNNQMLSPGSHELNINMSEQSSGIYFLVLRQRSNLQIIKMTLMK